MDYIVLRGFGCGMYYNVFVCYKFFRCSCMGINVTVRYIYIYIYIGLLPDIILLLTQCYSHWGTRLNVMKMFCL